MVMLYLLLITIFFVLLVYDRYLSLLINKEYAKYSLHLRIDNLLLKYEEEIGFSGNFPLLHSKLQALYKIKTFNNSIDFDSFEVNRQSLFKLVSSINKTDIEELENEMTMIKDLNMYNYFDEIINIYNQLDYFNNPLKNYLSKIRDNMQKLCLNIMIKIILFFDRHKKSNPKNKTDNLYKNKELFTNI